MLDPTAPLGNSPSVSEIIGTYGGNKMRIAQAIQMGLLDPTKGTLAGMEIDRIRNAATAEQNPTQTVAQQTLSPQPAPAPRPPMGMPSGPAPQMASAGLGARPPGMAAGGLASLPVPDHMFNEGSFAGGGIVSFDGGGSASIPINPYGATSINIAPSFDNLDDALAHVNDPDAATADAAQNFIASVTPPKSKFEDDQSYLSRAMMGDNPYGAPSISDLKFQNPSFTEPKKPNINIQGDESQLGLNTDDPKDYYAAGKALLAKVNDPKSNLSDFQKSTLTARANDYIAGARTSTAVADSPSLGSMIENLGLVKYFMKPSSIAENQNGLGDLATKRTADLAALGTPRGGLPTTSNPAATPTASAYPAGSNPYTANILTPMTDSKEAGLAALLNSTSAPPSRTGNAPMGTGETPGGLDLNASDKKAIASTGISPDIASLANDKLNYMGTSPTDTGLADEKAQLPKQKEEDKWTALANFGFSLAASKSKYFLQGVGEAGQSTVPMIQKNLETERATQRDIDKRDFDEAMQQYNVKGSAYDTAVKQFNDAADRTNKIAVAGVEANSREAVARTAAAASIAGANINATHNIFGITDQAVQNLAKDQGLSLQDTDQSRINAQLAIYQGSPAASNAAAYTKARTEAGQAVLMDPNLRTQYAAITDPTKQQNFMADLTQQFLPPGYPGTNQQLTQQTLGIRRYNPTTGQLK